MMIRATNNLLTILYACANGRLPWGVEWECYLPLCASSGRGDRTEYILCCGHTLRPGQASRIVASGLMKNGDPDKFGRPTITITDEGRAFLDRHHGKLEITEGIAA